MAQHPDYRIDYVMRNFGKPEGDGVRHLNREEAIELLDDREFTQRIKRLAFADAYGIGPAKLKDIISGKADA